MSSPKNDQPETVETGSIPPSSATAAAATTATARRVELPAAGHDKLRTWFFLLVTVGICLVPMLVELGRNHTSRTMEKISLLTSQETWYKQLGYRHLLYGYPDKSALKFDSDGRQLNERGDVARESQAWKIPTWNDRPRIVKPPMVIWLNLFAWSGLSPDTATPEQLILRSRLMGVFFVALALAATYWAGYSLGQLRTAALATLITGTSYLCIYQARIASYDTILFGWVTVAAAAGLWSMRPLREINWVGRRIIGWVICGAMLGGGILTKGPVAVMFVTVPLIAAIIVTPRRRVGNSMGLLFAILLGILIASPWYLHVIKTYPNSIYSLLGEYKATRSEPDPWYYYMGLFGLVVPWTAWLIGALFQPWFRAKGEKRRQLLVAWLWFILLLVIMSCAGAKKKRYIVPILPAFGILVAQLWAWHGVLSDQRQKDPGVNWLRLPHWVGLLGVSVVVVPLWIYQDIVVATLNNSYGLELKVSQLGQLPWWIYLPWGIALLFLSILGTHWHWRWKPVHAATVTALWMVVLSSVVMGAYVNSPHGINPWKDDATTVRSIIGNYELRFYYDPSFDHRPTDKKNPGRFEPNEETLFYLRRIVEPLSPEALEDYAHRPAYLMVRLDNKHKITRIVEKSGYKQVDIFEDGIKINGFVKHKFALYKTPAILNVIGKENDNRVIFDY